MRNMANPTMPKAQAMRHHQPDEGVRPAAIGAFDRGQAAIELVGDEAGKADAERQGEPGGDDAGRQDAPGDGRDDHRGGRRVHRRPGRMVEPPVELLINRGRQLLARCAQHRSRPEAVCLGRLMGWRVDGVFNHGRILPEPSVKGDPSLAGAGGDAEQRRRRGAAVQRMRRRDLAGRRKPQASSSLPDAALAGSV